MVLPKEHTFSPLFERRTTPSRLAREERGCAIRVLVIDDDRIFSDAIREILTFEGLDVADTSRPGPDALDAARALRPDLVLIDLTERDNLEVARSILRDLPETKIVALGASMSDQDVRDAVKAGIHGYVTKHASLKQFLATVRAVTHGRLVVPRRNSSGDNAKIAGDDRNAVLLAQHLSPREKELLGLLVEGASSTQIAQALSINPNTVRTHVQRILTKLQVHSRLEAATFAFKHGIVKVSDGESR